MAGYPPDMPHAQLSASDTLEDSRSQHEVIDIGRELHGRRPRAVEITPQSRLDRDLGVESLGRAELILRNERGLQVQLPAAAPAEAGHSGNDFATAGLGQRRSISYSSQE